MANKLDPIGKSSTGLEENLAALIAILFAPISSLIFFLIEKDSRFVKFHALQSGIMGVALFVLNIILGVIPVIGWILLMLLPIVVVVIYIMLMVKAYQGEWYQLPVVGKIAMDQLDKIGNDISKDE